MEPTTAAKDQPAAVKHVDIKLFVGRLPTTATEETIRPLFAEFGSVIEVVVIRDKATGAHKGSAFVRMASIRDADAAIRSLSGARVIDQALGPMQVSYAVGEPERLGFSPGALVAGEDEAKVFVGSLPRDVSEVDVLQFLSSHGKCYDAYLMRDPATKRFKGCGFIKFEQKEEALLAIRALHGVVTFPGATRPLELRIAEPKRPGGGRNAVAAAGGGGAMQGPRTAAAGGATTATAYSTRQQQQQHGTGGPQATPASIPHLNANPRTAGPWKEYFTADGRPYYHNSQTLVTQWDVPKEFSQAFQREAEPTGPPGANIFVFHVPNEWGKEDLVMHFAPFGHVVSAMVAMDHATQRNKGYGFVSYTNVRSALQAVQEMNLLPVGNKRLRVAIKNGEKECARRFAEDHGISFPTEHRPSTTDRQQQQGPPPHHPNSVPQTAGATRNQQQEQQYAMGSSSAGAAAAAHMPSSANPAPQQVMMRGPDLPGFGYGAYPLQMVSPPTPYDDRVQQQQQQPPHQLRQPQQQY